MTMKKRKDNKGRVLKEGESLRKDGRYQYRYNTIDNKRKTVYAKTLEELREKEQEIQSDIYNGFCTADRDITIQQMFVRCETVRKSLKPKTKMTYEYCYNRYAKDILGNKKVRDIKYSDMVLFFRYLLDEVHLKFGAVDMVYYPLVHVFKTAVRDNIIKSNPIEGLLGELKKSYQYKEKQRTPVSPEDINRLINFLSTSKIYGRYLNIFITLVYTGMRISELCGLTWEDCDIEKGEIHIRNNLVHVINSEGKLKKIMQTPKSEKGNRIIPMFSKLKEILIEEKEKRNNLPPITYGEYTGFVFGSRNNTPYSASELDRIFKRIVKQYNTDEAKLAEKENRKPHFIESCLPHQLRHSYCSMLCEKDVNIKIIQELMGHSSVAVTMDVYAKISEAKKHDELARIEDTFDEISKIE